MITVLILLGVAGIAKAVKDTLMFHIDKSIFSDSRLKNKFWNPEISWKNKYKNNDPKQGPKFLGSTTIFVFITDAWHLFQFIELNCTHIAIALLLSNNLLSFLIGYSLVLIAHRSMFNLFYKFILKRS